MKRRELAQLAIMGILALGLTQAALEAAGPALAPTATDVALRDGGVLVGQVIDARGTPLTGSTVSLRQNGKELVATKAGREGYFAIKGLRGGVYQIVAKEGQGVYRVWAVGTAPPAAEQIAAVVSGKDVVRGQNGRRPLKTLMTNPIVIGAAVATAVAIPVAIHNADDDEPASPAN